MQGRKTSRQAKQSEEITRTIYTRRKPVDLCGGRNPSNGLSEKRKSLKITIPTDPGDYVNYPQERRFYFVQTPSRADRDRVITMIEEEGSSINPKYNLASSDSFKCSKPFLSGNRVTTRKIYMQRKGYNNNRNLTQVPHEMLNKKLLNKFNKKGKADKYNNVDNTEEIYEMQENINNTGQYVDRMQFKINKKKIGKFTDQSKLYKQLFETRRQVLKDKANKSKQEKTKNVHRRKPTVQKLKQHNALSSAVTFGAPEGYKEDIKHAYKCCSNEKYGTPGPGHYEPQYEQLSIYKQSPKWTISKTNRYRNLNNDTPGPGTYNIQSSFSRGFTFSKAKRF